MKYTLRPYQQRAVEKLIWAQKFPEPDLVVLPTGSGKSLVIADLAHRLRQPVLILQPKKEILEQNLEKMRTYVDDSEIGVYSACMNRKDFGLITFATIGSIYKIPEKFAKFQQVIVDECHDINPKNLSGMYTSFFDAVNPKVTGMTATPYRLDTFYEWTPAGELLTHTTTKMINRMQPRFWHRLLYNINNQELIDAGYIVPMRYIDKSVIQHEEIPTNISHSEFNLAAYEEMISKKEAEIIDAVYFGKEIAKSVLVFCSSVTQAERLSGIVEGSEVVSAKTPAKQRAKIINDFKTGSLQTVFNVGVLTHGFDHPELDCVVLLRPTRSLALYYQMLGRGVRKANGKAFCNVIDLSGTVKAMGRIETIKVVKRNLWEVETEKGSWHKKPLYSYTVRDAKPNTTVTTAAEEGGLLRTSSGAF